MSPSAEHLYEETLQTLRQSLRGPEEMAEAEAVLNPLLDAPPGDARDALADRILKCARAVRDARSGMACDLALDFLRLAYDDARAFLHP